MGCDIHDYCEVFKNDRWVLMGDIFPSGYNQELSQSPYGDRDYSLFSFLANVRNYNSCKFLDAPRGIPTDCSNEYKQIVESWGIDGHSHSYFTIKELLDAKLDGTVQIEGVITEESYLELKKGNIPRTYCRSSTGPNLFLLQPEEMDKYLFDKETYLKENLETLLKKRVEDWEKTAPNCPAHKGAIQQLELYYKKENVKVTFQVKATWEEQQKEFIGRRFFDVTVPQMALLSDDPNLVRYVFFFDN